MIEKNALLQEKAELEKKVASNEILSMQLKDLTARLELKTKKKEDISTNLTKISDEGLLQELLKEKAYLESSMNYLDEKFNNTKLQADTVTDALGETQKEYDDIIKSVNEKRGAIDLLKKQLKSFGE